MGSYVEFKNVKKVYRMGEVLIEALHDATFEIEKGEVCVIVGASGAGKTTLLNILGGMDTLSDGQVLLDGKDISRYSRRELTDYRRYEIGFVFQFYNLIPNLTTLENVSLATQICRNPLDAEETLTKVGLKDRLRNFPAQLSGGEQQRVAIAGQEPEAPAVRRAHRCAGLQHGKSHPEAASGYQPAAGHDGGHHHPQHRPYRHGRSNYSHQERTHLFGGKERAHHPGGRHRMVGRKNAEEINIA